jgi:uncharacterized membrane protein (DUF373 family)
MREERPQTWVDSTIKNTLKETREAWPGLSGYERFEQVVALVLTSLISVVILVAVLHLSWRVLLLILSATDPLDHAVFQAIFGMIMTVLIALEFNHSIVSVLERGEHIIQVRTVLLIGILALARKFIILDLKTTSATVIAAVALALVALGVVYALIRHQDRLPHKPP